MGAAARGYCGRFTSGEIRLRDIAAGPASVRADDRWARNFVLRRCADDGRRDRTVFGEGRRTVSKGCESAGGSCQSVRAATLDNAAVDSQAEYGRFSEV